MATTRITDVVNPEVLSDLAMEKITNNIALVPGTFSDNMFPLGEHGTIWTIPYADVMPDFENFVAGTGFTVQASTQDTMKSVVIRRGIALGVDKIVKLASYKDPMSYLPGQIADGVLKQIMTDQIIILGAGTPAGNTNNQTGVAVTEALIQATKQKLGDKANEIKYLLCHSGIYASLENAGKITWQPRSQILPVLAGSSNSQVISAGALMVPTIAGLIIVQSDECPFSTPNYTSFLLGEKAMGLFYQQNVLIEFDRDILLQEDIMTASIDYVLPLLGVDYTSALYTAAALGTAGNYTDKWNDKNVTAAKLITTA